MTATMTAGMAENWYSDKTATFGDRLTGAREAIGLSQEQLAERIGVRVKTIQHWEGDVKEPRANRIQMLAGMLNVSLMWLLTGVGDGIDAPGDVGVTPSEAQALLPELREIRTEMGVLSEKLGRLESRLRLAMARDAA